MIQKKQFISEYYTESKFGFSQIGLYGTPYDYSEEKPNTIENYLEEESEYDSEALPLYIA